MNIDSIYLIYFSVLNTVFIISILAMYIFLNKTGTGILKILIFGFLIQLVSFVLLGLHGKVPVFISAYLGNTLLLTGFAFAILSITSYHGRIKKRNISFLFLVTLTYWLIYIIVVNQPNYIRIFFDSLWMAIFFAYGGIILIVKKIKLTKFRRFIGTLFILYAIFHVSRAYTSLFNQEQFITNATIFENIMYIFGNFILIVGSFGFILILKELDEQIIEEDNRKLKESNKNKIKLFSIISHDLRGPMGSIKPLIEVLEKYDILENREKTKNILSSIKNSYDKSFKLLENLLDWSRNQFDDISANSSYFSLDEIIEDVIELYKTKASEKGIRLEKTGECNKDIYSDQDIIKTVIRNLVSNSLKFTSSGGIITLKVKFEEGKFYITVKDTGIGIKQEKIKHIFEHDKLKSTTGTSGEIGTGLGLMLSAELIRKIGGDISIESKEGEGTKITIILKKND